MISADIVFLFLLLRYDKLVNVTKKQYIIFARVVELVDTLALGANRLACLFLYFIGVI